MQWPQGLETHRGSGRWKFLWLWSEDKLPLPALTGPHQHTVGTASLGACSLSCPSRGFLMPFLLCTDSVAARRRRDIRLNIPLSLLHSLMALNNLYFNPHTAPRCLGEIWPLTIHSSVPGSRGHGSSMLIKDRGVAQWLN